MNARIEQLVVRAGGSRQAGILAAGIGAAALVLALSWWATRPQWVPAVAGVPLENVSEMTKRLGDAKIRHRLDTSGQAVLVSTDDLARARVALARGGMPGSGRPGMELFDQPSWGMTDFTQRINYRRALEGELERTMRTMRGVEDAQVHLAIEESQSFRRPQNKAAASVVLRLTGGHRADAEVVQGIQYLVASSVGGLESDNVMVLDDAGRLLSAPNETGSLSALSFRQLTMRRDLEAHLEQKAEALVAQIVGHQNARVQVAAEINFDRVERTTESIDPDRQVIATEQTSEIVPGPQGGAGSRTAAATYDNPRQLETFSGAVGGLRRLTVAVLVNDLDLQDGTRRPYTDAELQKIRSLVESAVGYQADRGDQVAVIGMSFAPVAPLSGGIVVGDVPPRFVTPVGWVLALVAVFIIAFLFIRGRRGRTPAATAELAPASGAAQLQPAHAHATPLAAAPAATPALPSPPAQPTPRDRVVDMIQEQPDVAIRLIRSWLQESNA
jgi:flagellar M-ring protein FliF